MDIYIVTAALAALPVEKVERGLAAFFRERGRGGLIFVPSSLPVPKAEFHRSVRYDGRLGVEVTSDLVLPLLDETFGALFVLGVEPRADFEEIVLSCFLNAGAKTYLDVSGGVRDIADWQRDVRPLFQPREVHLRRLSEDVRSSYLRRAHQWLARSMEKAGFGEPLSTPRSPDNLIYKQPRLAVDLAQQTADLQEEAFGASFSTLFTGDALVHTGDYYRSLANFLLAIPDVNSVLDVGCGSGFLACYLAASGRFQEVRGVDASAERVAGARLHARMSGSEVRFDVMSMTKLDMPDGAVDLAVTCFALEQSGEHLPQALSEIRRVARKMMICFEPSAQYFPTLPSLWHVRRSGWAMRYYEALTRLGLNYAVRPNLLNHYYNPGAVFVIDLVSHTNPLLRFPALFRSEWPGGVSLTS